MILFILIFVAIIVYFAVDKGVFFDDLQNNFNKYTNFNRFELADAEFLVTLLARVAKADGQVSQSEARYVSHMLDQICDELGTQRFRGVAQKHLQRPKKRDFERV